MALSRHSRAPLGAVSSNTPRQDKVEHLLVLQALNPPSLYSALLTLAQLTLTYPWAKGTLNEAISLPCRKS